VVVRQEGAAVQFSNSGGGNPVTVVPSLPATTHRDRHAHGKTAGSAEIKVAYLYYKGNRDPPPGVTVI